MVDEGLEKEIQKLADKDGTISKQVFMKYAFSTHLCKEDPQELVSISDHFCIKVSQPIRLS